jgi:peptide/nickel transport system ATP-binding protein
MGDILRIEHLKTIFNTQNGVINAVNDVSFSVAEGEVLGLVGESGSGKSITCRSILRLVPPPGKIVGGSIYYKDENIMDWPESRLTYYRGAQVSMILQEPMTALNPVHSVGKQIEETIIQHEHVSQSQAESIAIELMQKGWHPCPGAQD